MREAEAGLVFQAVAEQAVEADMCDPDQGKRERRDGREEKLEDHDGAFILVFSGHDWPVEMSGNNATCELQGDETMSGNDDVC